MPIYRQDGGLIALNKAFGDYASSVSNLSGSLNSAADKLNQIQTPNMNNVMQPKAGPHLKPFPLKQPGGFFGGLSGGLAGNLLSSGLRLFEDGGKVYAQDGQLIPPSQPEVPLGPEANIPTEQPIPATGGAPMMPEAMPPQQPPMPTPKKSFAEKVAEAKMVIEKNKGEGMPLPTPAPMPMMPEAPMMTDAEGDGGVLGDVTYSDEPVGPDIGTDTVDAKLTPGEFVMNKEATEMYGPEIEAMNQQGLIAREMGGSVPYYDGGGYVNKLNYLMENDPDNAAHWKAIKATYFQDGSEEPLGFKEQYIDPHLRSGAIGKLGKSLVHIGQNDFTGASDALVENADKEAIKAKKEKQSEIKDINKILRLANSAKANADIAADPILKATEAKNILFTAVANSGGDDKGVVDKLIDAGEGLVDAATNPILIAYLAALKGGDADYADKLLTDYTSNVVIISDKFSDAQKQAYTNMISDITDLTTVALRAQGKGPKTDFDFQVAAKATANIYSNASIIKGSMDRIINNANETLKELGVEPEVSTEAVNKPTEPTVPDALPTPRPDSLIATEPKQSWTDRFNTIIGG